MTMTEIEVTHLTDLVGEIEIPCDHCVNNDRADINPAKWIMHRACCGTAALSCDDCKTKRVNNEMGVQCAVCQHIWFDSADAYMFIEPLKRG